MKLLGSIENWGASTFVVAFPKELAAVVAEQLKKLTGTVEITVKKPRRPKTTGERSQNSRIHGHCANIAEQLSGRGHFYSPDDIKEAIKRMAVSDRGFPTTMAPDGVEIPISVADIDTKEATMLIEQILDFAYAHNLWLYEYDDEGRPVKMVQGRELRR